MIQCCTRKIIDNAYTAFLVYRSNMHLFPIINSSVKLFFVADMFIFLSLVMGNGSWQAITPNRTMYLECDVKGLPSNIPYQIFWTKEGMSLKDLNSHGRINYFPNSKNLQIVRARKNAHQTLWNLVAI